jgi:uncharacterized membrane protein HdeD (DUF308 family)
MLWLMAKNWWAVVLRGICAVLFGALAWIWPGVTLGALVILWGVYAFTDGILAIASAFSGASGKPWWVLAIEGVIGLGVAALTFFYPGLTAIGLLYLMAIWAITTGIFELAAAIRLRKEIEGEFWLGLAGLASVAFGVMLIARPGVGAVAVVWIIGSYAMLFGVLLVALGLRLKSVKDRLVHQGVGAAVNR